MSIDKTGARARAMYLYGDKDWMEELGKSVYLFSRCLRLILIQQNDSAGVAIRSKKARWNLDQLWQLQVQNCPGLPANHTPSQKRLELVETSVARNTV